MLVVVKGQVNCSTFYKPENERALNGRGLLIARMTQHVSRSSRGVLCAKRLWMVVVIKNLAALETHYGGYASIILGFS
jgi:hypothetical protein